VAERFCRGGFCGGVEYDLIQVDPPGRRFTLRTTPGYSWQDYRINFELGQQGRLVGQYVGHGSCQDVVLSKASSDINWSLAPSKPSSSSGPVCRTVTKSFPRANGSCCITREVRECY
jgi:hypothetical protein